MGSWSPVHDGSDGQLDTLILKGPRRQLGISHTRQLLDKRSNNRLTGAEFCCSEEEEVDCGGPVAAVLRLRGSRQGLSRSHALEYLDVQQAAT